MSGFARIQVRGLTSLVPSMGAITVASDEAAVKRAQALARCAKPRTQFVWTQLWGIHHHRQSISEVPVQGAEEPTTSKALVVQRTRAPSDVMAYVSSGSEYSSDDSDGVSERKGKRARSRSGSNNSEGSIEKKEGESVAAAEVLTKKNGFRFKFEQVSPRFCN